MIIGICGTLGSGKTLTLTYLTWKERKRNKIFANFKLDKKIFGEYTYVKGSEDLNNIQKGFLAADELWIWLDSRMSQSHKNKWLSSILLKSRKREISIAYTAQHFGQIDRRVRSVTDILIFPQYDEDSQTCTMQICDRYDMSNYRYKRFNAKPIFGLYDTNEEIDDEL